MRGIFLFLSCMAPLFMSGAEIVIDKNVIWSAKIEIKDKITVWQKAVVKVKPGAEIIFKGNGQIICEGTFLADGAVFKADSAASGFSRMDFSGKLELKNCKFFNIVTENKRYHNAFLTARDEVNILACSFEKSSAVELVRTKESVVAESSFNEPVEIGLAIFHSTLSEVEKNSFRGGEKTSVMLKLNSAELNRIKQNRFSGNGNGVDIYGQSRKNIICTNSFFDNISGIVIGNTASENLIFSCLFDGSAYAGIKIMGGTDNLIRNCVMWKCIAYGIAIPKFREGVKSQASAKIINTAFSLCSTAVFCGEPELFTGELKCSSLWKNKKDTEDKNGKLKAERTINKDPLFVAPENGNFRLQMKNFGYKADSPLLKAGYPDGSSIGLFLAH